MDFEREVPMDTNNELFTKWKEGKSDDWEDTRYLLNRLASKSEADWKVKQYMEQFNANIFMFQLRDKFSLIESKFARKLLPNVATLEMVDGILVTYRRNCWLNQLIFSNCLARQRRIASGKKKLEYTKIIYDLDFMLSNIEWYNYPR